MTGVGTSGDPRELLGAYALGAVEGEEAEAVEQLLTHDAAARAELAGYRQATALLQRGDGPAPDTWHAIEQRTTRAPATARVVPIGAARGWRRTAFRVAAAAVAVAAIAATVVSIATPDNRSLDATAAAAVRKAARAAESAPGAQRVTLVSTDGASRVDVVLLPGGRGYVVRGNLARAAKHGAYALYALTTARPVLLGVIGTKIDVVAFRLPRTAVGLAVGAARRHGREVTPVAVASLVPGAVAPPQAPTPSTVPAPSNGGTSPGGSGSSPPTTLGTGAPSSPAGGIQVPITLPPLPGGLRVP